MLDLGRACRKFLALTAVLDRPAPTLDRHQGFHCGPSRAPGGEKGQLAISDIAADQQASQGLVVFGGFKIGQFQVGLVEQPLALAAGPGR